MKEKRIMTLAPHCVKSVCPSLSALKIGVRDWEDARMAWSSGVACSDQGEGVGRE